MSQGKVKNFTLAIFGLLTVLNILAWVEVYDLSKPKLLEVNFFDVGQGDAVFIETPASHQILIDGGPSSVILEKLADEMPFWDRSIDLIVLTHPEKDHLTGLLEILKRYRVENILWTGVLRDTSQFKEWQKLIGDEGARIIIAKAGQKIIMQPGGAEIDILYPLESLEGKEFKDSNNTSIVGRLVFNKNSFLFTGDAYQTVERELIDLGANLDSDVLKVGHHGSKTSSSEEFIAEVSPEIAVISTGKNNSYGHPHPEVLEVLKKYGIRTLNTPYLRTLNTPYLKTLNTPYLKILRTDEQGDIKIISNGINYAVSSF